ncbi:esterase E4-like [Cylas formicarius]|uniref:esterase E4-like n=1 Tax=Cylas formicarius TaxID=197179 RepID=UPI0029589DDC|nr:esterase E4-like [Cylas formicarius]
MSATMAYMKLLLCAAFLAPQDLINGLVIDIRDGKVEGLTSSTRAGTTFNSFLAMRYAEAPIGDLRFELPQKVKPWNGVYDATEEKHICYQVNMDSDNENEDCLFINVFTPQNLQGNITSDIPVLVFIHGGGFIGGTGYIVEGGVGPNFFMDSNIIFVAFNYRLGPFGFLSTGDEVIPGNLGLKDQETSSDIQISKGFFYAPVLEVEHESAFITERIYELFENGRFNKVPVIMGINAEESIGLLENGDVLSEIFNDYDNFPSIMTPFDLHLDNVTKDTVGHLIKDFYAGEENFKDNLALGIHFHSAHDFEKASIKQAQLQAPYVQVYFYEFTYSGLMGNNKDKLADTGNVTHGEELNYLFSKWYSPEIPDNTDLTYFPEDDRNVHYYLITLWTNFVKYLNPTPKENQMLQNVSWSAVQPNQFQFLNIGKDLVMTLDYPKRESYVFWQNIFDQYAVKPLDTF